MDGNSNGMHENSPLLSSTADEEIRVGQAVNQQEQQQQQHRRQQSEPITSSQLQRSRTTGTAGTSYGGGSRGGNRWNFMGGGGSRSSSSRHTRRLSGDFFLPPALRTDVWETALDIREAFLVEVGREDVLVKEEEEEEALAAEEAVEAALGQVDTGVPPPPLPPQPVPATSTIQVIPPPPPLPPGAQTGSSSSWLTSPSVGQRRLPLLMTPSPRHRRRHQFHRRGVSCGASNGGSGGGGGGSSTGGSMLPGSASPLSGHRPTHSRCMSQFFMDTGLTRNLSVLPEDLNDVVTEFFQDHSHQRLPSHVGIMPGVATPEDGRMHLVLGEDEIYKQQPDGSLRPPAEHADAALLHPFQQQQQQVEEMKTQPSTTRCMDLLTPYLGLVLAVTAVSSKGGMLALQEGVSAAMTLYWRMTATSTALAFFAVRQFRMDGFPILTTAQWITTALAVMSYVLQNLFFNLALNYTSVGNTVIFSNSQAVLLLIGKLCMGKSVLWLEAGGAIVAFGGAILCSAGEASSPEGSQGAASYYGDMLGICSAFFGVLYLTFAKAVRPTMSVMLFMFLMMFCGSFFLLSIMLISRHSTVTFSRDKYDGMFGWTVWQDPTRLATEIWLTCVCNVVGTMGFVRAMQHFDTLILAVATLLEPVMATLIAAVLAVGDLPNIWGWIGNVLVAGGTLAVVYPSVGKGGNDDGGH